MQKILLILAITTSTSFAQNVTLENVLIKTDAMQNNAPGWTKPGTYVYRVTTPDSDETLRFMGEGIGITYHLLDRTVRQIPIATGLIGHDHPGDFNWDGGWPYWGRATFRTGGWDNLRKFMTMVDRDFNTKLSFHLNLTDVNVGLRDYPETQEFFKKLVETKSIYRREWNKETSRRDIEPPVVPQVIDFDTRTSPPNPVEIFALVNYKRFWDSGLAKSMIDEFYGRLPYAPPLLYLDVLNAGGGNFSTGYPDGPLGGSRESQIEGVQSIGAYLRGKGTDLATEGDQSPTAGKYGTYQWLHAPAGYSADDYSVIAGAAKGSRAIFQQVFGNTGSFVVTAVASTPGQIAKIRAHYKELLAGQPITRKMPGLETWHISDRGVANDEFNMALGGGHSGDPFRGDWIDLVNNFYLSGIQELYHLGKGNYRTASFQAIGVVHISKYGIIDPSGKETNISVYDSLPPDMPELSRGHIKKRGAAMMEEKFSFKFTAPAAGTYKFKIYGGIPARGGGTLNVYVNNELRSTRFDVKFPKEAGSEADFMQEYWLDDLELKAGENEIGLDCGPIVSEWNDGTRSIWQSPTIGKGFKVTNGDVTFAEDYDRMWPDTWSGEKKIYLFSWDGTSRTWKLPLEWRDKKQVKVYPLTPDGRGKEVVLQVQDGSVAPKLLPQVPYILTE